MGFCSRLEAGFPLNAVKEGLDYALEGRVDLVYCDANTLRADVFEDEHFADVRIQIRTQGTALFCTCPAFRLGSGCKHLYAAMYAADRRLGCDRPAVPDWKGTLATLRRRSMERRAGRDLSGYFLSYHLDIDDQRARKGAIIHVERQRKLKDGSLSRGEEARLNRSALWTLAEDDREALSVLFGGEETAYYYSEALDSNVRSSFLLSFATLPITLAIVCKTGRLHFRSRKHGSMGPLSWDPEPWAFLLRVRGSGEEQGPWRLSGHLVRGDAETALDSGLVFLPGGLFIHENRIRRIADPVAEPFISTLLEKGPVEVPRSDTDELLEKLFDLPAQPATEWPEELRPAEMDVEPRACLRLGPIAGTARVWARVSFQYGGYTIRSSDPRPRVGIAGPRVMVRRQLELERAALSLLDELGFLNASRRRRVEEMGDREIASRKLPGVVRTLMQRNWLIEAEGKLYRKSSGFRLSVSSGMDWFDLEGHADFDGRKVSLPVLLAAVKRGEGTVVLDDGLSGSSPRSGSRETASC